MQVSILGEAKAIMVQPCRIGPGSSQCYMDHHVSVLMWSLHSLLISTLGEAHECSTTYFLQRRYFSTMSQDTHHVTGQALCHMRTTMSQDSLHRTSLSQIQVLSGFGSSTGQSSYQATAQNILRMLIICHTKLFTATCSTTQQNNKKQCAYQ